MKRTAKYLIPGFLILCLLGCPKENPTTNGSQSNEKRAVTLTMSKNMWCTLPIIAAKKGFFEAETLDIKTNYVQAAKFSMDALVGNSTDFAAVVEVNVAYLGFTGNKNVNIVGTFVESYDGAIVASKSSGVTSPADLKGKKLGILQGTTSQIFADKFLEKHNVPRDQVDIINLAPPAIQTSVTTKEIAAGSLWEPFIHNISKALGDDGIAFFDKDVYTGYMNLAVRADWAEKNKDAVTAFLKALRKAEAFVRDKPEEAKKIIAEEINLDPEVVKSVWDRYLFKLQLAADPLRKVISEEGKWIKASQKGFKQKAVPDYSSYVNDSYLKSL